MSLVVARVTVHVVAAVEHSGGSTLLIGMGTSEVCGGENCGKERARRRGFQTGRGEELGGRGALTSATRIGR